MTDECPNCGRKTEGVGGVAVGFRGVPPGGDWPPVKPSPMPHQFECEACGHKWEKLAPQS